MVPLPIDNLARVATSVEQRLLLERFRAECFHGVPLRQTYKGLVKAGTHPCSSRCREASACLLAVEQRHTRRVRHKACRVREKRISLSLRELLEAASNFRALSCPGARRVS